MRRRGGDRAGSGVKAVPSYSLKSRLGDCWQATEIRQVAVERMTGRSLEGLPIEGFDYQSILGQCCEMPIGFVQIPVGVAGPFLVDDREYNVPIATTEGCRIASTNSDCKVVHLSGIASSMLLNDAMTRAPVVRFSSARRASQLKFFLEDPLNFALPWFVVYDCFIGMECAGQAGMEWAGQAGLREVHYHTIIGQVHNKARERER